MKIYKNVNGKKRELTQEELDNYKATRPESEKLEQLKAATISQIKKNKTAFIYSPIKYNGETFINSEIAGNNLRAAYHYQNEPIDWLDLDGKKITLTKSDIKSIIDLTINKRGDGYFQEADLIKQVKNASSISELKKIDISKFE